ncbi:uncharacterized protein LOC119600976 isoform X4 [Lucilia sericata]|uniref:uncharacterized protein LOC119600976 isoform X4 n=1 Tax=Lucilia sericata TaxID=13632 RepID=UPI0018A86BC2|nr:uncharacterized protein LOC119600976 isoform X4 [Lucilia sericata]XP_037807561.1 uncharacterized protein LOC119600976 isoform X4 [Lucilia sericata]
MKLNGALKPRQGASKQGSSPGVVQRKYRVKRYYKVNENVGLPLSECGVNNKHLTEIINNSNNNNNIYKNNNQQQHTTPLAQQEQQQQPQKRKCGEHFSSSNNSSLSSCNFSTSTANTTQYSNSSVTTTRSSCIDSNSCGNKDKIQQTTRTRVAAKTAAAAETVAIEKYNKKKTNIESDLKQRAINNITTRQFKNTNINKEKNNSTNNKSSSSSKKTKEVKVVKTTLNTSKYHVIVNKNNNSSSSNTSSENNIHYKEVNKSLLLIPKFYENLNLTDLISRLFIHLKLLLFFVFSHAIKHLTGNPFVCIVGCRSFGLIGYNLAKIMRASQSLESSFERICFKNVNKTRLPPSIALCLLVYAAVAILLPQPVVGDDGDTFFPINGLETTTPEFDYASRGQKKFGDKCENTLECGFPGSICDPKKKSCQCTEDLPVTNHIDKCGKEAAVNETCFFNEQCEVKYFQTECRDQRCVCRFDMTPVWLKDGSVECKGRGDKKGPETYIDPAMIGVLIGMALMFIIICVVLRLFSQARWRENRTIFNTPNPRLMNVSLLRESKLLHGQERRGSRMSVRAPSRQPSMASLRPHSPNPSLGSRSNSHGSNASATSLRSTRSNSVSPAGIVVNNSHHERKGSTYQPHQHQHPSQQKNQQQQQLQPIQQQEQQPLTQTNIISNPVAETVTVEIIEPEK